MKPKTEVYAVCAMIGAAAGWYLGGYQNSHEYAYDEHFLEQMANMTFLALEGAFIGSGIAAVYHAGKRAYSFLKNIREKPKIENITADKDNEKNLEDLCGDCHSSNCDNCPNGQYYSSNNI